jgi:phosphohistidine phosphatase
MHQLHLLRHAKSSPDDAIDDHERQLSRGGREDARRIGENLPRALGAIDLVLCSTALRTRQTAELTLAGFAVRPRIVFEGALYLASRATLMRRLRRLDESNRAVLLIGHNPGLHELASTLAAADSPRYRALVSGKFPTSARASFAIDGPWVSLDQSRHALIDYVTPKSLAGQD